MALENAIVSNGTTNIFIPQPDETPIYNLEKSMRMSAGGKEKEQVGGRRFKMTVEARVTYDVWEALLDMLEDQSTEYFYTPGQTWPIFSAITFPIACTIKPQDPVYQSKGILHIRFDVSSVQRLKDL